MQIGQGETDMQISVRAVAVSVGGAHSHIEDIQLSADLRQQ